MKIEKLIPEFVEFMPAEKEDGILYISRRFELAIHKCACGCGGQSVTPIGNEEWSLQCAGDEVTLHPSILNRFCGSHYWIKHGSVEWCA